MLFSYARTASVPHPKVEPSVPTDTPGEEGIASIDEGCESTACEGRPTSGDNRNGGYVGKPFGVVPSYAGAVSATAIEVDGEEVSDPLIQLAERIVSINSQGATGSSTASEAMRVPQRELLLPGTPISGVCYGLRYLQSALRGRRVSCPLIEMCKPAAFATNPVPQPAGHRVRMKISLAASSLHQNRGSPNLLGYR